jgi:hypothetical protein
LDTATYDSYWYRRPKAEVHDSIFPFIRRLSSDQRYRQEDNIKNMRLYGNNQYSGLSPYNYRRDAPEGSVVNRVTLNVIQSMVDTVNSKITKNKPRPYFLTDGGNWSLQRKAEKLTKFAEGQFYATDFYAKAAVAFKDSTIFGTGALKIYRKGDKIEVERTFIDELLVEDTDAYYGRPRQMHQLKWVHKDVLKAAFPKHASAIDYASTTSETDTDFLTRTTTEMILVVESWRLPTSKDAKDGVHTICIDNKTLFHETYSKDYFPFVFFRWNEQPLGFFGQGISEQLTGLQLEINKLLRTIQVSMHLVSVPKIFVEAGSKIVSAHINNKIGGIIKYAGTPPTPGQLGSIPPELFAHLDRLYGRAFEIVGVSQLSAQSTKPAGLDSGKALRTFNDIETERFMSVGVRYEQVFLDATKILIDLAKDIASETGNYSVKVPGSKFLSTINWKDVEMEEDQYILRCYPTNAFSQEPAAKFQEVQERMQAGLLSREEGLRLLDFPDLNSVTNLQTAPIKNIEKQIEQIADGKYSGPEPFQNLALGIRMMQSAYLNYQAENAPDEVLELFRTWIAEADALMKGAQAEVAAQQMAAQGAAGLDPAAQPLAAPAQPPVSDLLPNVPGAAAV